MKTRIFLPVALSAILLALSRLPLQLGFLVFWAFIPLFHFFRTPRKTKTLLIAAAIFSMLYTVISLHWINLVTIPGFIGMIILFWFYFFIFFFLIDRSWRYFDRYKFLIFLLFWLCFEFLQNFGEFSFPWFNIAYSLAEYLPLLQIIDIGGIYLLSVIIISINIFIYRARKHTTSSLICLLVIIILWAGYGLLRLNTIDLTVHEEKAAIVQVSIPQDKKWQDSYLDSTIALYDAYTLTASREADLVIWPESAYPVYLLNNPKYKQHAIDLAKNNKIDIFTGFPHYERAASDHPRRYKFYNAATRFTKNGAVKDHYEKNVLVPFGERIPFLNYLPFLWEIRLGQANWEYGTEQKFYDYKGWKYSPLICFEIAFERLTTKMMKNDTDFIVNITNDAWFHRSSGTYQHAVMTKFRAIETRRQIFRAANTGYSMIVSPSGEIQKRSELFERTVISENIITYPHKTIFTKYLFWFPYLFVVGAIIFVILIIYSSIRKKL